MDNRKVGIIFFILGVVRSVNMMIRTVPDQRRQDFVTCLNDLFSKNADNQ
jgi:hypothetical protein